MLPHYSADKSDVRDPTQIVVIELTKFNISVNSISFKNNQ
jgi:hypothetical protein